MLEREAKSRNLSSLNSVWFSFSDLKGRGLAEVDHLLWDEERVWIFETKLTQVPRGILQVEALYKPLVSLVYAPRKVTTIMVCQHLMTTPSRLVTSLDEVLTTEHTSTVTWHWLGR